MPWLVLVGRKGELLELEGVVELVIPTPDAGEGWRLRELGSCAEVCWPLAVAEEAETTEIGMIVIAQRSKACS